MKPIDWIRQLNPPYPPEESRAPVPLSANRFLSLRTKFVLFFSLILVITCSSLSWYYVEERREALGMEPLKELTERVREETKRDGVVPSDIEKRRAERRAWAVRVGWILE